MQNDSSVRHIAITCPHCGKHYKKVPYEAIKKYRFAVCKKCTAKFTITAAELEEALRKAAGAVQQPMPAAAAPAAADVSQAPSPAEPPREKKDLSDTAYAPQAPESAGLDRTLEQKISDLAATMQETFSKATEADASGRAGYSAEEPQEEARQREPAQAAPEAGSIQIEGLPDFTPFSQQGHAEQQPPLAAMAGEESPEQAPDANLYLPAAQPAEENRGAEVTWDAQGAQEAAFDERPAAAYPEDRSEEELSAEEAVPGQDMIPPAPEEQVAEEAFVSPELTFSYPDQEEPSEEPPGNIPAEFPQQAPGEATAGAAAPFYEEPLPPEAAEELSGEAAAAEEFPEEEMIPMESGRELGPEDALADSWPEISEFPKVAPYSESGGAGEMPVEEAAPVEPEPELFEEELLDESLIEDAAGPAGEEALPPQERAVQNAGDAAGLLSMQTDSAEPGQEAGGARDVSAMLKQFALPADTVEEGMEQFVLFTLGKQTYAAPIANVCELSLPPELIAVPNTPPWILGISNMRGEIISVVDFREFLSIEAEGLKKPGRMIIAQTTDHAMVIGLLVDSIRGIKYFPVDDIQPLDQQEEHDLPDAFCQGSCRHESDTVVFLDLEHILTSPKMRQFQ